jgi:uncharacterized protein YrzB (UPF0473 family)
MDTKEMIYIQNSDGSKEEVELVTYLISDDNTKSYLVYSKGEKTGVEEDEVIYISRVVYDGAIIKLQEIEDDTEWSEVQRLLKKIANA